MPIAVRNPRTGELDYQMEPVGYEQIAQTAARLRAEQPGWLELGPDGRAAVLLRWADALQTNADTGRLAIARVELFSVIGILQRWAASGPGMIAGLDVTDMQSANPTVTISNRHIPYSLFGAIAPWNFPLLLALIDAIPALMAGCAAIVKPSEVSPRFIPALRKTIEAVPPLAKTLAVVEGDAETGRAIVDTVDYVCFTGSVATGRKVAEAAARAFIPANLELGGKDPMIILASADPEMAAAIALRASVTANGQACQSIERVYVARAIAEPFLRALVAQAKAVRPNYPDIAEGEIGSFIFAPQADVVAAQLADARAMGATILTGGEIETLGGGKYLRPTVITGVTADMSVITEETFGPVIPVTVFDDVEDAICLANDSIYGLSAAVIGDVEEAERVGARLEAGAISINDGSMTAAVWDAENASFKLSGMGPSRMGSAGLTRFFRTRALIRQNGTAATISAYGEQPGLAG
jgi:acyl-CoA reductase-like NAD-dependent aldehyde dehydrogenase